MKQIKVLKINQKNVNDKNEVCNVEDENIIKEGTYNFFIKTLEIYRKKEFEDEEQVTEFIKLTLSKDEETAKKQWFDGVTYEGNLYKGWFATVGGMKQENNGKCEVYFLNEVNADFKSYFENIISLGKFAKVDTTKDMYVNKEILSRFSLATSDIITEIDMPNIIILPQAKLPWNKTYKTVQPKDVEYIDDKGEQKTGVDYDLIDYEFNDELEVFDGGGIATPEVMNKIGQSLSNKRTDIDFAIIRGFGIAIKGMITKFDIIEYLEIMHNKIGDTDYCKKVDEHFELLDMYGEWREVTDNTLLLNKSMVKLSGMFKNMEEYTDNLEKCNKEEFMDVYNLLNKLYITKVNKPNQELKEYRRMNYQFFNALALTENEYNTLAKEDFRLFKKLLKPYDKAESVGEFKINIDTINIFFNQCCNVDDLEEENNEDTKEIKEITSVVDKSNALINLNQDNIKLKYVKDNLARLTEKKIRDMAQGRLTLKASYNYIAIDPISYMNFAMTREQGENGLNAGEFYCNNINSGETRTIFRNPLMAYSEIHNINFIKNQFLDNWLCKSEEIVYFNQKSDIQNLMGSCDSDGDSTTMVDNEIVKNAVVVPVDGKYFCFTADGVKKKGKFDEEGRFLATYKPSGNLIGKIAILAVSINNDSQTVKDYYKNNKFYSYDEIEEKIKESKEFDLESLKIEEKWKFMKDIINKAVKKGSLTYTSNADSEVVRAEMKKQFYENEKDIYSCLYCSSLTIDSPKTMNIIDVKDYTRVVQAKYEILTSKGNRFLKANFLQYKKKVWEVKDNHYRTSKKSLLDKFGKRVQEELLDCIANGKRCFSNRAELLQDQLKNDKYDSEVAGKCWDILTAMYSEYVEKCDKAKKQKLTKKDEKAKLNEIEAEYLLLANELLEKADIYSIAKALSEVKPCSERFIISYFMKALIEIDRLKPSVKYLYGKDSEGDINYMYDTYKKVERVVGLSDSVIEQLSIKDKVRFKQAVEIRFKAENVEEIVKEIEFGLKKDGFYDLDTTNKVQVFDDFKKKLGDRTVVKVKGFMLKNDGTKSISKKSFGIVIDVV